jgi:hypothetical protein
MRQWLQLSLNREVPSSLLLLSTAFMMRDEVVDGSFSGSGSQVAVSPAAVKLGVLRLEAARFEKNIEDATVSLSELQQDIEKYLAVTEAETSALEAARAAKASRAEKDAKQPEAAASTTAEAPSMTTEATAAGRKEGGQEGAAEDNAAALFNDVEDLTTHDTDLLLRSKEAEAVKAAFVAALNDAGVAWGGGASSSSSSEERPRSGTAFARAYPLLPVPFAATHLHTLLVSANCKNVLAEESERFRGMHERVLRELDEDNNGIDYYEFVTGYQEVRRRHESMEELEKREEALRLLEETVAGM